MNLSSHFYLRMGREQIAACALLTLRYARKHRCVCRTRRKGHAHRLPGHACMKKWFHANRTDPYPSAPQRAYWARHFGLSERQVNDFCINMRRRHFPGQTADMSY